MNILLRRHGRWLEIGTCGPDNKMLPLPSGFVSQHLLNALSYTYSYCERDGGTITSGVQTVTRNLAMWSPHGTLFTGAGCLQRLAGDVIPKMGCRPLFQDVTPQLPRPNCYETDWEAVRARFQFRPRQEDCLMAIANAPYGGVIDATMGFGKAQPVTEPVLTPTGWKPIGELRLGDLVIGSDGKATAVLGVFPQGCKQIAEVRFSDESRVLCCWEHLWAVSTPDGVHHGRPCKVLTTEQLSEDLEYANGYSKWFVPVVEPVAFAHAGERPLDPYLLGVLLGDGGITQGSRVTSADQWLLDELSQLVIPMGLYLRHITGYDYAITHGRKNTPNPVTSGLRQLGLFGLGSHVKFVPDAYKYAPVDVRLRLLQGLMDTDGTVSDDPRRYAEFGPVASLRLAEDVCELVRSLGGVTRVQTSHRAVGVCYRVRTNLEVNLFRLPRKAELWKSEKMQGRSKAIRDIQPAGEAECVCIAVANEDGLYVTSGYTVTHNTHLFQMAAVLYPRAKMAIVVAGAEIVPQIYRGLLRHISSVGKVTGKGKRKGRVTVFTADSFHHCDNDIDILFGDEAHELVTEGRVAKLSHLRHARAFLFSGSVDDRMDGLQARLEPIGGPVIFRLTYQEGVQLGLVVPMQVIWLPIDLYDDPTQGAGGIVRKRKGIWRNSVRNRAIANYVRQNFQQDEQILISVDTFEHAIFLKQLLPEFELAYATADLKKVAKYKSWGLLPQEWQPLDGETRERLRNAFTDGQIRRVIATSVWSRGVSFDGLSVMIRADGGMSGVKDKQWPGRASRIADGKMGSIIIDCADKFNPRLWEHSLARYCHYEALGWAQQWPYRTRGRRASA